VTKLRKSVLLFRALTLACSVVAAPDALAQDDAEIESRDGTADDTFAATVTYPADFFDRYKPNTALDMINQLPGFLLDDGDSTRGFASAAGNILINDRRPSAKQDLPSAILARIPAIQVERIELLRGQVRDIDLQGQAQMANIILREVDKAAYRWRGNARYNVEFGTTTEGAISVSDRWRDIRFNTGIQLRDYVRGDHTPTDIIDGAGNLIETRFDLGKFDGFRGFANFNASSQRGETMLRFNARILSDDRDGGRMSERTLETVGALPTQERFLADFDRFDIELGVDAERKLRPNLNAKAILIYFDGDTETISSQLSFDEAGVLTRERVSAEQARTTETIARAEFNWAGWAGHAVQINVEGAFNSLDNSLLQTEDTGAGPVVVDVPGSNSEVEETRADLLIKDTWTRGRYEIEYGLGAEFSTISQTGDADLERDFKYLKPQFALIYAPNERTQSRVRLWRDVSQLDFSDFVSSTVFEDDDLALGNPNLEPETSWRLEFGHEWRFGKSGVVKVAVFRDWVSDVEDLLPLSPTFEAPGNIGDGRRVGIQVETALPLDRLGLKGARLDINARWQDTSVDDPVTGEERVISDRTSLGRLLPLAFQIENEYAIAVDFRQDLKEARVAWGWDVRARGERPFFKVNELDVADDETEVNVFVETTRWLGLKTRFSAVNILDLAETRDRTIYVAERGRSPIERRELRSRERGFRVELEVSGSF